MSIALPAILVGLLVLGFSAPVALGATVVIYFGVLTDLPSGVMQGIFPGGVVSALQDYVIAAIALFVFYGRLCAQMDVRDRFATSFTAIFGGRRIAATTGEILASLIQPDTAGDALLQRNDEAAATVNRLRLAGTAGWSAIGQAAGLACLRVLMPPGVVLIILGLLFEISIFRLFEQILPLVIALSILLLLLALPAGRDREGNAKAYAPPEWRSLLWVFAPIVILGSIFAGLLTTTEAAALAVAFALLLGTLLGQLPGRRLLRALLDTLYDIGAIFLVIVFALVFSRAMLFEDVPHSLSEWFAAFGVWLAFAGLLVAALAAGALTGLLITLFVLGPMALGIMLLLNADPMHFAIAFVMAATLGLLVPPTGAIFATLAAGTTERLPSIVSGIGYFALAIVAVFFLALLG